MSPATGSGIGNRGSEIGADQAAGRSYATCRMIDDFPRGDARIWHGDARSWT